MAQYRKGTASVTSGSATVTGTDTEWLSNVQPGDAFLVPAIPVVYTVAAVTSDTALQLSSPYAGTDRTDDDYVVVRDFTTGGIPELNQRDIETATIFTRAMRKIQELFNNSVGVAGSGAPMFGSTAAGLAGTSADDYFWVLANDVLQLYQNDNGSATAIGSEYPTAASIQAFQNSLGTMAEEDAADYETATVAGQARSVIIQDSKTRERSVFESATGGLCTIQYTPKGQPCYMNVWSKARAEDLAPGGQLGTGTHEAFIVDGVEKSTLLLGMYPTALVNGEPVSQPGLPPLYSKTFDQEMALATSLGADWHQMTIWEWAFVALWCMANGFEPHGNTNYGRYHAATFETAARQDGGTPGDSAGIGNTLAGYGPNTWRHNNAPNGMADLVGNVWERLNLMKMVDGRIFLADDNNPSLAEASWTDTGWDMTANGAWATRPNAGASDALKRALIVPNGVLDPAGYQYLNLSGERIPLRGGGRPFASRAGLGALRLYAARSAAHSIIGFRLARLVS